MQQAESLLGLLKATGRPIRQRLEANLRIVPPYVPQTAVRSTHHLYWVRDALTGLSSAAMRCASRHREAERTLLFEIESLAINLAGLLDRAPEQFGPFYLASWASLEHEISGQDRLSRLNTLVSGLRALIKSANDHLAASRSQSVSERRGPAPNRSLDLLIEDLLRIYSKTTAQKPTYNPYRGTADYDPSVMRTPASQFVKLVVDGATAVYREVQPEYAVRRPESKAGYSLSTALRHAMASTSRLVKSRPF